MSIPKSQILTLFDVDALTKHQLFPLLDEKSLCLFSQTSKKYHDLSSSTRDDRKKAVELLFCVLNPSSANIKQMEELLSQPQADIQSIILIRVAGKEVYFSKNQNKILPGPNRVWPYPMSPLEAAFRGGDFPLVQRLVDKIPGNQQAQALKQLQNVRAKCSLNEPGNYLYDLETLREAYKAFLEPYQTFVGVENYQEIMRLARNSERQCELSGDGPQIKRLAGCLGEAQKNLPWYLLQVFCNPVQHCSIPNFTKESMRVCILDDLSELDLDSMGAVSLGALYKSIEIAGDCPIPARRARIGVPALGYPYSRPWAAYDSLIIDSLCELLPLELDKIIKSLENVAPKRQIEPH